MKSVSMMLDSYLLLTTFPSDDLSNGLTRLSAGGGSEDAFPFRSFTLLAKTDSLICKRRQPIGVNQLNINPKPGADVTNKF